MRKILEEYATKSGWDIDAMLDIACEYIENQDSAEAFKDFVAEQAESAVINSFKLGDFVLVAATDKVDDMSWGDEFVGYIERLDWHDKRSGICLVRNRQDENYWTVPLSKLTKYEPSWFDNKNHWEVGDRVRVWTKFRDYLEGRIVSIDAKDLAPNELLCEITQSKLQIKVHTDKLSPFEMFGFAVGDVVQIGEPVNDYDTWNTPFRATINEFVIRKGTLCALVIDRDRHVHDVPTGQFVKYEG